MRGEPLTLKNKIQRGELVVGTFSKIPSVQVAEALALSHLDTVCFDCEHAPFDRLNLDSILAMWRALGREAIVRVPYLRPEYILSALDCGAGAIMAPHITSKRDAEELRRLCHFGSHGRGFAGATRSAQFGQRSVEEHLRLSRDQTVVIAMIEDLVALEKLDEIFEVSDIDLFFIGRADLTVALGETDVMATQVFDTLQDINRAAKRSGVKLGMFTPSVADAHFWINEGINFYLMQSDWSMIMHGANALAASLNGSD